MTRQRRTRIRLDPRPWVVVTAHDCTLTLGEGEKHRYATPFEAFCAFAHDDSPFKACLYDNGHTIRELNRRERDLLEEVCRGHGVTIEHVDGDEQ
jgi:hypothetical protein